MIEEDKIIKQINSKEDIIDFFDELSKNKNDIQLFQVDNNINIVECTIAIISLTNERINYKDLYDSDTIQYAFITYRPNHNFLKRNLDLTDNIYTNDQLFNISSDKYIIEFHIIEKGKELDSKKLIETKLQHKTSLNSRESLSSETPSEKSFRKKVYSAYKKYKLPRGQSYIHHGRKELIEKSLTQVYPEEYKNDIILKSKINEMFIDITIAKHNLQVKDITDNNIREKFLLFPINNKNKKQFEKFFGYFKYNVFFSKQSLSNYISSYLVNILFTFTHISESLIDFLSHVGIQNSKSLNDSDYSIDSSSNDNFCYLPLRNIMKKLQCLIDLNKKDYLNDNLNSLKRNKKHDSYKSSVQMFKFIKLKHKYNNEHQFSNRGIKHQNIDDFKEFEDKDYFDTITNNLKEDLILNDCFKILYEHLFKIDWQETDKINDINYFIQNALSKNIMKHVAYNGFTNIDVISNEDGMIDFNCCHNKEKNTLLNSTLESIFDYGLGIVNKIFNFNEGFFHKHLSILGFSYNFNHTSTVVTVPTETDSAMRNKLRVFDVLFLPSWANKLSVIINRIWNQKFQLFNNFDPRKTMENELHHIINEDFNNIIEDYFQLYDNCLPNLLGFSNKLSDFVEERYNMIDNVCQHFANKSLDILLRKNISDYSLLYLKHNQNLKNQILPNFDSILEPYLIHSDSLYLRFLNYWSNKQSFINIELKKYEKSKESNKEFNKKYSSKYFKIDNNSKLKLTNMYTSIDDFGLCNKPLLEDEKGYSDVEERSQNIAISSLEIIKKKSMEINNDNDVQLNKSNISQSITTFINNEYEYLDPTFDFDMYNEEENKKEDYNISKLELDKAFIELDFSYSSSSSMTLIKNSNLSKIVDDKLNIVKINNIEFKKYASSDSNYYFNLLYMFNLTNFYLYKLDKQLMDSLIVHRLSVDLINDKLIQEEDKVLIKYNSSSDYFNETINLILKNFETSRKLITKTQNMCHNYIDYINNMLVWIENQINKEKTQQKSNECYIRIGWITANLKQFK